jgi:hypothetical protein
MGLSTVQQLRTFIKRIDSQVLGGVARKTRAAIDLARHLRHMDAVCDHSMVIRYSKDTTNQLSALCDRYGSDKGTLKPAGYPFPFPWPAHTFADFYSLLFGGRREAVRNVFECGLGTNNPTVASSMGVHGKPGASLRVWRDYFPNAEIVGADIDRDILFSEDRITTHYLDQTDPASIAALWATVGVESFDLMLDDGLHVFEAGVCLFENANAKLSSDGVYIIEDVASSDLVRYQNYFAGKPVKAEFVSLNRPGLPLENNNLVVIRR